jgi:mRNA-degrading endonuclease YafQ of YafQ-DinJ toxin-antitoxin module
MTVGRIYYGDDFIVQYKRLPEYIQKKAIKCELLFRNNPLHPSLRLHQLKGGLLGLWSLSISAQHRIIFSREEDGGILFISIGKHDLYKAL